jgi:hypothetical protein
MPKKNVPSVPRPNAFLYYSVVFLAGLYFRWFLGLRVDRSAIKGIRPPFFVVAGHASWLDFITVTIALYPHRMNYIAAYNFFRNPVLKFLLGLMGASKNQLPKITSYTKRRMIDVALRHIPSWMSVQRRSSGGICCSKHCQTLKGI